MIKLGFAVGALAVCLSFLPAARGAAPIIADTFTANNSKDIDLSTHVPNTSPGSGKYHPEGAWGVWGTPPLVVVNGESQVTIRHDEGAVLSLAGVTSPTLTIAADLKMGYVGTEDPRNLGLGFFSATSETGLAHGNAYLHGLVLTNTGALQLFENGNPIETVPCQIAKFDPDKFYTLSFSINRTTGGFSNVTLGGVPYKFSTTHTFFNAANTAYAGFAIAGVVSSDIWHDGKIGNLRVWAGVPPAGEIAQAKNISPANGGPIRVACVGDSITAGYQSTDPYPSQLQGMLGTNYEVCNFGVSARTLLKHGDIPYWNEKACQDAKDFDPNVVVLMLGSNDTKPQNWSHRHEFYGDYKEMVESFQNLASKPKIYVCLPPPAFKTGGYGITQPILDQEYPIIKKIAADMHLELIDMHAAFEDKAALFPDNIHPNAAGDTVLARTVADALTGKTKS